MKKYSTDVLGEGYKGLVEQAATLVPVACKGGLADRGCAETALVQHLQRLGWHCRIRIKAHFWSYRPGHGGVQVGAISLAQGQARFWQGVCLTIKR